MNPRRSSGALFVDPELRQLGHDVRHELATVMLLASLLADAPDVGEQSRHRARQLGAEARWLRRLVEELEQCRAERAGFGPVGPRARREVEPIRLDVSAIEAVEALRLAGGTMIRLHTREAWARIDRLAFWRTVRNLVDNAVRAAGPSGRVDVKVHTVSGWAVAEVRDDGPGFGAAPPGLASLGLDIAGELLASCGGELHVDRRRRSGCRIRMRLPSAAPSTRPVPDGPVAHPDL
ncbi:MAG TPA: HAMP domain-containing sensor histidine kinase [Asanoa sp.]|nr:HAMP domain-containing sensor histidine kinase [Asanoa sp.]